MFKISRKFRIFWKRNGDFLKVCVLMLMTFLVLSAGVRAAGVLPLDEDLAPENIPKFTDINTDDNDLLIQNDIGGKLVDNIINIAKYILGGVFMIFLGLYVITFLSAGDKEEASKKFKDQMLYVFIGFAILALAQPFSEAFNIIGFGDNAKSGNILTDPEAVKQAAKIVGFSYRSAARVIQYVLGGIALITMGMAAFSMITAGDDEESVKTARKTLVWATLGLIFAALPLVDKIFAPDATEIISDNTDPLLQHELVLLAGQMEARAIAIKYVKYFQTFIGAGAVFSLFLAGFKMVAASGQEEIITKQKKMITWIFIGLGVILISEAFVNIFLPEEAGEILPADKVSKYALGSFSEQIGGFTNFLLTFSGAVAVLALIVGALYVSTAVANPEQAEKGKKILLAATLGIVILISAYALVNTVLSGKAA